VGDCEADAARGAGEDDGFGGGGHRWVSECLAVVRSLIRLVRNVTPISMFGCSQKVLSPRTVSSRHC
jgi:hypothetical protein